MTSYDPTAGAGSTGTTPPSDPPPTTSPAGGTPLRPPLQRSRERRVVAGVCGGLGEYFGVDPVLFRVVLVVLTLFGGWGLLLYLLGWLLIPDRPATPGDASTPAVRNHGVWWIVGAVVLVLLVVPVLLGIARALFWQLGGYHGMSMPMMFGASPLHLFWPGAGSLLLLVGAGAVIWWLVRRDRRATGTASTTPVAWTRPTTAAQSAAPVVESTVYPTTSTSTATSPTIAFAPASTWTDPAMTAPPPPVAPTPRRQRSVLGPLTVSITALVVGVLLALRVTGHSVPIAVIFASALAVVALGLLVAAWVGRSRGLIVLGLLLSVVTAVVAAFPPIDLSGGFGERNWHAGTAAGAAEQSPYRLGVGNAQLDLTSLTTKQDLGPTSPIEASIGVGQLTVYLPANTDVYVTTHAGLGTISWQGMRGTTDFSGRNVDHSFTVDRPVSTTTLLLDLSVGMGRILIVGPSAGGVR
jgi:phage shock protein PspC (stress-responsive transcriptional regulator)